MTAPEKPGVKKRTCVFSRMTEYRPGVIVYDHAGAARLRKDELPPCGA